RLSPGELVGVPVGETGELTINANLVLQANANTAIALGGVLAPICDARVVVNGTAPVDGDLNIGFVNGFVPPLGTSLTIMTYNSKVGDFAHINLPPSPSCL